MRAEPVAYSVVFRPVVKQELDDIVAYYEEQKAGLGLLFIEVLDVLLTQIQNHPLQFPVKHKNIRRAGVQDFPYNVFFRLYKKHIAVLAVIHQKRNPKRWKSRK